jgi:hypothetical protein
MAVVEELVRRLVVAVVDQQYSWYSQISYLEEPCPAAR